jgi:hypothetical protein
MYVMIAVDAIHTPGVKENQQYKDVDRPLLRKPEPELKTANTYRVQFVDEKDAESVGTDEPDREAKSDQPQVGTPVGHAFVFVHR